MFAKLFEVNGEQVLFYREAAQDRDLRKANSKNMEIGYREDEDGPGELETVLHGIVEVHDVTFDRLVTFKGPDSFEKAQKSLDATTEVEARLVLDLAHQLLDNDAKGLTTAIIAALEDEGIHATKD